MNPTRGLSDSLYPLISLSSLNAQLNVTLSTNSGAETLYTGTIDSLVETPVPEPAYLTRSLLRHNRLVRGRDGVDAESA